MPTTSDAPHTLGDVTLAHDRLASRDAAARVALEMTQLFAGAPLHTAVFHREATFDAFGAADVRTPRLVPSRLAHTPVGLTTAFRQFSPVMSDVLISSSAGGAHQLRTTPETFHAVYCHRPASYVYNRPGETTRGGDLRFGRRRLYETDQQAAREADLYLVGSKVMQDRVRSTYEREALVVPPPVGVERFRPTPRGERLLVVEPLRRDKHVDLVIAAARRLRLGLDIVGEGPDRARLEALAGPDVVFHGSVEEDVLVELMEGCRTVVAPAVEAFSAVPIEAQAAGKPVVAFAGSGARESVDHGFSGVLVFRHEVDAFVAAIEAADALDAAPADLADRARRFSRGAFRVRLLAALHVAREYLAAGEPFPRYGFELEGPALHV
jgi:glycosyltransferase involved in cell wall biosynthesis